MSDGHFTKLDRIVTRRGFLRGSALAAAAGVAAYPLTSDAQQPQPTPQNKDDKD